MTVSRAQFIALLDKTAQDATELAKNEQVKGEQSKAVPALLQPDVGDEAEEREPQETLSNSAEKIHRDDRHGAFLENALSTFVPSSKQTDAQLKGLLSNYTEEAGVSKPQLLRGKEKSAASRLLGRIRSRTSGR